MLETIGVRAVEDLFSDIPAHLRNPKLDLPPALSELEVKALVHGLAGRNTNLREAACFLGAGAYRHFIPSVVWDLAKRSEFLTSYTPYQPEISQGMLQGLFEYQSLICLLTGMEAANTGMYDGATAIAEAVLMACRITGRSKVAVMDSVSPTWKKVVATYTEPQGIGISPYAHDSVPDKDTACIVTQSPNFFGYVEDLAQISSTAHQSGALMIASCDPIALGMFQPPGAYDADIVVGEGQPLGVPLSFGGPYLGLFACKNAHLRQMPGRIVGRTTDVDGKIGYVLTLQTREQHIRRERATSNICTSESLVALAASIYLAALGKAGLRQVAELCYHKAHYAAGLIGGLPGYSIPFQGTFFKEFAVQCPAPPSTINRALREEGIIGGLDISTAIPNGMLLCVTEMNSRAEIDSLARVLSGFHKGV
ncbi:MAG: glycine dehydrogenase (decarboxylating) alpha subunit [Dehalococcoidia bacterium]|nr:glycine dehydrogenase (decarboxylating) alpha subunit [Dehalococcoidia bacterium]